MNFSSNPKGFTQYTRVMLFLNRTYLMKSTVLFLFLIASIRLFAVDKPATGTVRDAKTNEPLPFTNIAIDGKYHGTVANVDGHFVLDVVGLEADQVIVFSYVGYETLRVTVAELAGLTDVYLKPAILNLNAVAVYSKELTAKDILERVKENFEENYPQVDLKQRIFYHKYEKTLWPKENEFVLKSSDFVGLDRKTFEEIFDLMPEQFVEYHDAIVDMYNVDGDKKLEVIEAVSLEEGSLEKLQQEVEHKLGAFLADIESSQSNPDIYFKFRSGIFAGKMDDEEEMEPDSIQIEQKKDSLNYIVSTDHLKESINRVIKSWADIESDNWEFINKSGKYNYKLEEITIFNDELVYPITFTPEKGGLFEGKMYISTANFAILQLDYAFAKGKQDETIQILGIGHSLDFKKARVIFEKGEAGYFVKYVYAEKREKASINRDFSVMKKEKRFFIDKELNEIKMSVDVSFDMSLNLELLILNREALASDEFDNVIQPKLAKFKKEYAYSPEVWNNRTVIAPSTELQKFKRAE